jgi:glycosyltransferase involved in cell wall biosynthesis
MDIFVMPSYREGFSVTNIEAATLALPVISTRIPGCVDSVADGKTGTLVAPRDTEALIAAIERYYTDPILRADHGRAGRERVLADFQPERVFSDVAAVYEALLGRKV